MILTPTINGYIGIIDEHVCVFDGPPKFLDISKKEHDRLVAECKLMGWLAKDYSVPEGHEHTFQGVLLNVGGSDE